MKQFLTISTLLLSSFIINAQSEKYQSTMQKNIALLDSVVNLLYVSNQQSKTGIPNTKYLDNINSIANTFERIGNTEKIQWLPYYYTAYAQIIIARNSINIVSSLHTIDDMLDKADNWIDKAISLDKENSETDVLKSMLATSRIMVEPMTRGQKFGPLSGTYLQKAIQLDSTNPRPVLISGMNKYYTPEQWGGDKKKAVELFKKADEMDKNFKPASALHPAWGKGLIDYMLKMSQKLTQ